MARCRMVRSRCSSSSTRLMPAVCPTMRALPDRLAEYMAVSARASSSSAVTPESAGASSTTPTLTPARDVLVAQVERALQGVGDPLGGGERVGAVLQQHRELVAAEPGHGVAGPGGAAQPLVGSARYPVSSSRASSSAIRARAPASSSSSRTMRVAASRVSPSSNRARIRRASVSWRRE